jgi:hypothetical protein
MSGIQGAEFVVVRGALAFPCFRVGMLALPLCGAAPTFLCLPQRKVGKRKRLTPLAPATIHLAPPPLVAPERLSSLAAHRSDKALILPAALRAPKGITKTSDMHSEVLLKKDQFPLQTFP